MTKQKRSGKVFLSLLFVIVFIVGIHGWAVSAPPGIDTFQSGLGVATWTTNAASPFTGLIFSVRIIDYNGIATDGSSHTLTVMYPNGGLTKTLPFLRKVDDYSAIYELYDGTIPQPISSVTYSGIYSFRVTRASNGEWSEATDHLIVNSLSPPDETTFAPGLPEPQSITAYFDEIYANESLYDDFSQGFRSDKWQGQPSAVTYTGGQARFQNTWDTSSGSIWMRMLNPSGVNSIKASARVTNLSGSSQYTRARIGGYFCRVSQGHVFAFVGLRDSEAFYSVAVEGMEGNDFISTPLLPMTSLGSITLGNKYELSVEWDSVSQFIFRVIGMDDSVNFSALYTLSETVSPATDPWKGIGISTWSFTGTTTPTFSWNEVPEATYYRVRIYSHYDSTLYAGYSSSSPYVLPPGILKPYGVYKYRIEAIRDHQWFEWDNVAASDRNKTRFLVDAPSESQTPHIDLSNQGVFAFNYDYADEFLVIFVRIHDAQGVPGNIDSVTVELPDGLTEVRLYFDASETPSRGTYRGNYFGTIQEGLYTFTVVDKDGYRDLKTDLLTLNTMAYPSQASLTPEQNAVMSQTAVSFSWEDVGAAFYELQVYDKNVNSLYGIRTTENQYTLPAGLLQENQLYKYRLSSFREFPEHNIGNRSEAVAPPYLDFFTTPLAGGTAIPAIDLINYGVVVFSAPDPVSGAPTYELNIKVRVSDDDGVPENIQRVEAAFPDGTIKSLKYYDEAGYGYNYFYQALFSDPSAILSGEYVIRVVDFDGNEVELADTLADAAYHAIAWPTNVRPPNGTVLGNTTPRITWNPVNGASYYTVRILGSWGASSTYHWSEPLTQTQYTVPFGLLAADTTYSYRVYAYREPIGSEVDFSSTHVLFHSLNYRFTTGKAIPVLVGDLNGDGGIGLDDAILGLRMLIRANDAALSITNGDVSDDGRIGIEDVIYIFQFITGLR